MISRTTSRALKGIISAVGTVLLTWYFTRHFSHLPKVTYITGWLLFLLMIVLAVYNGRKKLPFLPMFTSEGWLQFHIYAGFFTLLLFLGHLHVRLPTGKLEVSLALLYLLVMASGIIGLFISRTFPKRLTIRGGEVIFEKIPIVRRALQERTETIALSTIPEAKASTVADFYANELTDFFSGPRNFWQHVFEIGSPLNRLQKKIEDLNRFLNEKERASLSQIADLVRQKDGLDYHFSLQMILKVWLFVHIPLTYSLLIFSLLHIILVYAFAGGAG